MLYSEQDMLYSKQDMLYSEGDFFNEKVTYLLKFAEIQKFF
jgi:hypothetical protein